jgi:hypothetical protein
MKMKKRIKRFNDGMGVEDDSPEMQSSTIDRNAMRLINESGRKVGSGSGKSKDKSAVITKKEITVSSPEDNLSSANSDDSSYDRKELRNRPKQDNTNAVSYMPNRGMRTRTEAEKEAGAKTLKEGLPFAIPMGGAGIKMGLKAAPALEAQAFKDMMLKRGDAVKKMFEEQKAARAAQRAAAKEAKGKEIEAYVRGKPESIGDMNMGYKKGGKIKKYAKGGMVSASSRADGIAQRGKTRGKVC